MTGSFVAELLNINFIHLVYYKFLNDNIAERQLSEQSGTNRSY